MITTAVTLTHLRCPGVTPKTLRWRERTVRSASAVRCLPFVLVQLDLEMEPTVN